MDNDDGGRAKCPDKPRRSSNFQIRPPGKEFRPALVTYALSRYPPSSSRP
ncbi:hypothetical protein GCM10027402_07440 [Arthrobacter monumenti]